MKKKYRKSFTGIRFQIAKYMILFAVGTIGSIILIQSIFFKTIYKKGEIDNLKVASNIVKDTYYNKSRNDYLQIVKKYSVENDIYVSVFDEDFNFVSELSSLYQPDFQDLIKTQIIKDENESFYDFTEEEFICNYYRVTDNENIYYLTIYTLVVPIDSVQKTLSLVLYMAIISIVILSIIISWFISKIVSKPIKKLENDSKHLILNDPNFKFESRGYKEVESLSEALNYANKEICNSNNLQKTLISNVSHDIRTPLTLIKAYAEMIKDISGSDEEKRNDHLNIIIKETNRLTSLVNNILELSKIESKTNINMRIFNLSNLVNECINTFNIIENEGYVFIKNIDNDLFVSADEQMIKQVMYNLISNAVNYTLDKKIIINVKLEEELILVEVIDRGYPIEEEKLPLIWERYYRDENSHVRSVVGSGLGLPIVKKIFEQHNLKYGVESKDDIIRFYFYMKNELV